MILSMKIQINKHQNVDSAKKQQKDRQYQKIENYLYDRRNHKSPKKISSSNIAM